MNCPWKTTNKCANKCLMGAGLFILATLVLSLVIKIIARILDLFSYTPYLNTAIVIIAMIIALLAFCKCCSKSQAVCCDDKFLEKENASAKAAVKVKSSEISKPRKPRKSSSSPEK